MNYEILYQDAFPVVRYNLAHGQYIKAESDAMIAMSSTIDVDGKMEGGVLGGLIRKALTGESFFLQTLTAARGKGHVLFGPALPGGVIDVDLDGSYGLTVQKGGFLAATSGINIGSKLQNLSRGLLSGDGFFVLNLKGTGTVFISSYGSIHSINLDDGEEVIIDNGHLVAWPDYMNYKIEKASKGLLSSYTSGEGIVCRFRGPGTILIQTRNPKALESWIQVISKKEKT